MKLRQLSTASTNISSTGISGPVKNATSLNRFVEINQMLSTDNCSKKSN